MTFIIGFSLGGLFTFAVMFALSLCAAAKRADAMLASELRSEHRRHVRVLRERGPA